jgi:hypothetical protein
MTNDPRERLSVVKFPFRAVTPENGENRLKRFEMHVIRRLHTMMVMMMAITPSLNASSSDPGNRTRRRTAAKLDARFVITDWN